MVFQTSVKIQVICGQTYYKVRITTIFILVQINNSGPPKKFLIKFEFCALLYSGEGFLLFCFFSSDQNEVGECN